MHSKNTRPGRKVNRATLVAERRFPVALFDKMRAQRLEPGAVRLYVTGWAVCDDSGRMSMETVDAIEARWGAGIFSAERLGLAEVFADLERLGFVRRPTRRGDFYVFTPSTEWMS